ncbi:hypothetical protein M0R45_022423 [Rubus argutus]|uniref:CRM domain-containing protein n=1 Tax=Rubus argutus TaxID=59490 RepID=A0AAW1XGD3_RUBAR
MLWKPAAPVYPKLIQEAPEGLTKAQAEELRKKGKRLLPICRLAKNGVYITLVRDVRHAFEGSSLVKIDCKGMHASDYKKLGAKLKELVPCVLLSFDDEQILMWRGPDWISMSQEVSPPLEDSDVDNITSKERVKLALGIIEFGHQYLLKMWLAPDLGKGKHDLQPAEESISATDKRSNIPEIALLRTKFCKDDDYSSKSDTKTVISSPKMMSLWKRSIDTNKALLLDELDLDPDALLKKIEEFEGISQATEHSYPALILSSEDGTSSSIQVYEEVPRRMALIANTKKFPPGSLPIDVIAEKLDHD